MATAYIYSLIDPRTGEVRYVGKTTDPDVRLRRHVCEKGDTARHKWLAELHSLEIKPEMQIVETVSGESWKTKERFWIAHYRAQGCALVNSTSGGQGAPGISPSAKTRELLSDALKRAWCENPRSISPEHFEALVAGRRATPQSPETREKIRQAIQGIKRSDETREKISQAKRGKKLGPLSEERKRKIGMANKGERNGQAKLTMAKARDIRERYAGGSMSLSQLGREYGVDAKQIHRIVRNESWQE